MSDPSADALALIHAELRLLRERMDTLVGELRSGKRRARKRRQTVARCAAERVESVPVTDLDRMRARKALRKAGML